MEDLTEIVKRYAYEPYVTCNPYEKCGQCYKNHILSVVCQEYLIRNSTVDQDQLRFIMDEADRRWRETDLYKRIAAMQASGKSFF